MLTFVSLSANRLSQLYPDQVFICTPVEAELYYGVFHRAKVENLFRNSGGSLPIEPYDLQIAAIALEHKLTVVTHNVREFSRVTGLQIEDWENPGNTKIQ